MVVSLVASLFEWQRPFAILWRIGTFVIDALNRIFLRGAWSHVGQKCVEGSPTFTNSDTALTVIPIRNLVRVGTAGFHAAPDSILWRQLTSFRGSMFVASGGGHLARQTAATSAGPAAQIHSVDSLLFPAFALAEPLELIDTS